MQNEIEKPIYRVNSVVISSAFVNGKKRYYFKIFGCLFVREKGVRHGNDKIFQSETFESYLYCFFAAQKEIYQNPNFYQF